MTKSDPDDESRSGILARRSVLTALGAGAATLAVGGVGTSSAFAAVKPYKRFRPVPPPSSGSSTAPAGKLRKPIVPSSGVVLGTISDFSGKGETADILTRESQIGRTYGISSHYYDYTDTFPGAVEAADVKAGRVPMVTWWGLPLNKFASGANDAQAHAIAKNVKAFGSPILLRFAAEMNGDWFNWSGTMFANGPALFVAAWRRLYSIFQQEGATNAAWVWAPNADSHPGGYNPLSSNSWRLYYPGDDVVDWVGIDGYNWGATPDNDWESFGSIFTPIYNDYNGRKPIMIAETSSVESGGSKATWITQAGTWLDAHPGIKAVVWFDTNRSSTGIDWRIDSSSSSKSAFIAFAKKSTMQARLG